MQHIAIMVKMKEFPKVLMDRIIAKTLDITLNPIGLIKEIVDGQHALRLMTRKVREKPAFSPKCKMTWE